MLKKADTPQSGRTHGGLRGKVPRVHISIARNVGIAIVSGRHAPGDILPNEVEASGELNVSRGTYREAIRILAAKGLVESKTKVGTRVTPKTRWSLLDPEVLSWLFSSDPAEDLVQALFELRMIVEPAAAGLAAERRNEDQLERMRNALVQMQAHTLTTDAGQTADREFHGLILEATGNAALITLSSSIGSAVRWTTAFKQRRVPSPRDPMPEHWTVFDAIAARRPSEAHKAMAKLVSAALVDTQKAILPR